jgi:hypothetical protein
MRTVFVFPRAGIDRTRARITRLASPTQHDPWVIDTADDPKDNPAIYVDIYTTAHGAPLYCDWEPREMAALEAAMGNLPWWSVTGDVTGRIDGGPQVRALVLALLADGGVATDEYSDHCWTAQEIHDNVRVDGLTFFDHQTSYEREHPRLTWPHGVPRTWLAVDANGLIGRFSTHGAGPVPAFLTTDDDAALEGAIAFGYQSHMYLRGRRPRRPLRASAASRRPRVWLPTADFTQRFVSDSELDQARRL